MPAVMFWVQHLLGTGHLERVRRIAEELATAGHDVHFVTGGVPVPGRMPRGVRVVQLPPVCVADASFTPLRDEHCTPIDDDYRRRRVELLLAAYEAASPAVVLFETFPFGRRSLRFELLPLLERIEATRPRPRLVSSIRDILRIQENPERNAESRASAERWFDAILVHGDARFVRIEDTFPLAAGMRTPVHYTGYVTAPEEPPPRAPLAEQREVVISAGGGGAGTHVLEAAARARPLSGLRDLVWRILVGPGVAEGRFREIAAAAGPGLVVERNRPDFPALLARARVSVSQAGYNTVMDVVRSGAPAVMVPFEDRGETEQRTRATRLADLGLAELVDEEHLAPETLAAAVDAAAARPRWGRWPFAMDGARRSAELIARLSAPR